MMFSLSLSLSPCVCVCVSERDMHWLNKSRIGYIAYLMMIHQGTETLKATFDAGSCMAFTNPIKPTFVHVVIRCTQTISFVN